MAAIPVSRLQGVYTALITPMKKGNGISNSIDFGKLEMLVEDQIKAGVHGLLACGTTGQSPTLSVSEQLDIISAVYGQINGRVQFMAGAGSNSTREAIDLSKRVEDRLDDSVTLLHVTGYYNGPTQLGLQRHFQAVADAIDPKSNIILYNVPSRTNSDLSNTTVLELAKHKGIIGIKEAGDVIARGKAIEEAREFSPNLKFRLLSGEDHLVAESMKFGSYGVISAAANVAPRLFKNITANGLLGHFTSADRDQRAAEPIVQATFSKKNPIPLAIMFNTELRLPMAREVSPMAKNVGQQFSPGFLGINLRKYQ